MDRFDAGKKKVLVMLACWSTVCIWIILVFYLSYQKGEQTASLSSGITEMMAKWFPRYAQKYSFEELHSWIRKAAHVFLFLALGMLAETTVLISIRLTGGNNKRMSVALIAVCTIIAVVTEIMKTYIPGRHLNWGEAALNVISTWCGMGLAIILGWIFRWIHRGRNPFSTLG